MGKSNWHWLPTTAPSTKEPSFFGINRHGNSDTRGRSGWVHSSRDGALRQSRALQQPAGEGGAVGTGVARNLGTDPRLGHPKLSQTSRDR